MACSNSLLNRIVKHTKQMRSPCLEVRQKQGFHDFMLKCYLQDHTFNNYPWLMCVCVCLEREGDYFDKCIFFHTSKISF